MSILQTNWRWLLKKTTLITSSVYTVLSMLALWVDFTSVLSHFSTIARVVTSIITLISISLVSFIGCLIYLKYKDKFILYTADTGHTISLQFGDILSLSPSSGKKLCSVVIPVNRCFDTTVDDRLIAKSSLHGQFIESLISLNLFSPKMLNARIQESLADVPHQTLNKEEKPLGNLSRYPVGTITNIEADGKRFYLLGLSSFDNKLKATTTKEEFARAIQLLITHCDSYAQGGVVYIPVIGTGLSRVGVQKNDALQYLFHTLILNKEKLSFDLNIVVPQEDRSNTLITKF